MNKGNMKLTGNGEIIEGEYQEIKIMGNATSNGEVKADTIHIMGGAHFNGNIEAGECVIHGNAVIKGNIVADRMKVNGNFNLEGDCRINELTVNGKTEVDGVFECNNVVLRGDMVITKVCQAKDLKIYGGLSAKADVLGEQMTIEGRIDCKGLLSAEEICLHACENSYCKEIGATKLLVEKPFYHLFWLGFGKKNGLSCDLIEADEIKLEYTRAKIVRGKQIQLVKACQVDTLEYSEQYIEGEACEIREVTKVD